MRSYLELSGDPSGQEDRRQEKAFRLLASGRQGDVAMTKHVNGRSAWGIGLLFAALVAASALWMGAGDAKVSADMAATGPPASAPAAGSTEAKADAGAK